MSGRGGAEAGAGENGLLYIYSDGASRGNPGPAGIGGQAMDSRGRVLAEVSEFLGETTNNVAEYQALIEILEASAGLGFERVKILTDSELLVGQLSRGFRVKSGALKPMLGRIRSLLGEYREAEVEHIPREKNIACDALANRAIDEGLAGLKKPIMEMTEDKLF